MNIDALRILFNDVRLGVPPAEGEQAVTALALRQGIEAPALEEAEVNARANFGCASNRAVMEAFLRINPIMNQFCIHNCNAGVFSGRYDRPSVIKMSQLLSYFRLRQANAIQDMNREGIAMYQAYAMAELFGPYIPNESRLTVEQSRQAIITAVHTHLHSEDFMFQDGWYHAALGLGENEAAVRAIARANMTIHQALVILETWSGLLETSREWLNGISFISSLLTSMCKQGSLTSKAGVKIITGIKNDHPGVEVFIPERTVRVFFTQFSKYITADNAVNVFTHYRQIIPAASVRLLTIIEQAADSGMTVYTMVVRALNEHQDWPYWRQCIDRFPNDFNNFQAAIAAVGGNHYFGFNRNLGPVSAAHFKSLGYLSQQILHIIGGDDPISRYQGLKGTIPGRDWIDAIITHYTENEYQFALNQNPTANSGEVFNGIIAALAPAQDDA